MSPQERGYAQVWAKKDVRDRISAVAKSIGSNSVNLLNALVPLTEKLMVNGLKLKTIADRRKFFETVLEVLANPPEELDAAIREAVMQRIAEKLHPIGQRAFD